METIFKVIVATVSLVLLFTQCEQEPNPYDPVDFPDQAFLEALIEKGLDTNGDGLISYAEAEAVITLNVDGPRNAVGEIQSMEGLEAFINLDTLHCCFNKITELDVSKNTSLEVLVCWSSQLISLDVSKNKKLKDISVPGNQLTSLDVSNNIALTRLWCGGNQLSSLDVSNNIALNRLWCWDNQLSSLDVSNNIALEGLGCGSNHLTNLDVSKNTILEDLYCESNQIATLDVSKNIYLTTLVCKDNQLSSLDISKNSAINQGRIQSSISINLSLMPSLYEVCVWTMPFPPDSITIDTTGSPNVAFTTDCSK